MQRRPGPHPSPGPPHPDAVALLRCPHCHRGLQRSGRTLRCDAGHAFDVARQGYVNLLTRPSPHTGDTAAMVAARGEALAAGHLAAVTQALATAVCTARPPGGALVDVGAGTGHHTSQVLDALPDAVGVALDVSVYAVRRAARAHPRLAAAVCDVWSSLPLADAVAGVVTSVFAPRNAAESARVLRSDGALVVVTPTPDHLVELVGPLALVGVDPHKARRLADDLGDRFTRVTAAQVEDRLRVGRDEVRPLVAMGPSAHHLDEAELERRVAGLPDRVDVTVSVDVRTYTVRGG